MTTDTAATMAPPAGAAQAVHPSVAGYPLGPFDFVIFGGSGDLALRKLLPALFLRWRDGQIHDGSRILAAARDAIDADAYRQRVRDALGRHLSAPPDADEATRFLALIDYEALDVGDGDGWARFARRLPAKDRVRVFYLATSPALFVTICHHLREHGLAEGDARVVVEKPIGHDLASARAVNDALAHCFAEHQTFRIDHYLGKETVQNLTVLRFGNALFEPLWNAAHVDHVQITVAETVGLEWRATYYDAAGALRDMVQNHLLQLLCLVAMEPPASLAADAIRDEKLKVLRALAPIAGRDVATHTVRGQYRAGASGGQAVPGYVEELGRADSRTDTFVALRAEVRNWRWAGVPFFLRTGKRLAQRVSEIVVQFRDVPHSIFSDTAGPLMANKLVLRLQPDEGVKLWVTIKAPGPGGLRLRCVPLDMSFAAQFGSRQPDAYERLLMDVVRGNPMLFMRRDEIEAAWEWCDPILAAWQAQDDAPRPYTAGSWGPSAAVALIERDGRTWHEDGA